MDFDQTWCILSPSENMEPINLQGHRVKLLGEGIRHALRCPCYIWRLYRFVLGCQIGQTIELQRAFYGLGTYLALRWMRI